MSIGAGPPPQPPQLSPDHKWIWDGTQWRPIAQHEAVFPTWKDVGAGVPGAAAPGPAPAPVAPAQAPRIPSPPSMRRPASPPAYSVAPPAPETEVPLWKRESSTGVNKLLYLVAGFIVLVIAGVILSSGVVTFPWQQLPAGPTAAKPTPPITERSDSVRADRFITGLLGPLMSELNDSVALTRETCAGGMTSSCQDSYIQLDNKINAVLPVIDQETLPTCITPQTAKLRADLVKLDTADQLALKGFKDNKPQEFQSGAAQVGGVYGQVQADNSALASAAKSCDSQLTGP